MKVDRSLGSGHLFWVHAVGGGGDAHADCPAISLYFSWSVKRPLEEDTSSSCQSRRVNLKDRKRWTCSKRIVRREAALRAA